MQEVEEHISFRNSSKTRTELKSPYNFLPFFLPRYFNNIDRIIYLDTDIVVKVWNIYPFECKLCDVFFCSSFSSCHSMCDEHFEHFQNTQNMFSNVEAFCFRWMPRFLPDDFGALPLFFTMLNSCLDFGFFVWNQRLKVGAPWTLELSEMCSFLQGNIEELLQVNLDGRAVAAVEDCSQKLETYFDFEQLKTIQAREEKPAWVPKEPIDPQTCVFNRGVLVIDTKHWLQENLTEAITWWMDQFQSADKVLYKYVPCSASLMVITPIISSS
jgi:hypothetical protein